MAVTVKEYIPNIMEKPRINIASDKFNHEFVVQPTEDGFVFYRVTVTAGNVPKELQGKFSTMSKAVAAVKEYERRAQPSKTKQRDAKTKVREEEKLKVFDEE